MKILFLIAFLILRIESQCPPGSSFIEELSECIIIDQSVSNFTTAETSCATKHGHLLSIHSVFENLIINAYLQQSNVSDLYIGFYRNSTNQVWNWTDGSPNDYVNWASGEPGTKLCGSITGSNSQWKGVDCSQSLGHVCAISLSPQCPQNWYFFNGTGQCYYHGTNASFSEAEKVCRLSGGHLASVHSDDENDFIKNLTYSTSCTYSIGSWITGTTLLGGTFDQTANRTTWWNDGSVADYTHSICQNEGTDQNTILLRSFPMNTCPQDEEKCGGGNWRIGRYSINNSIAYPDYVCKAPAINHAQCPTGWSYLSLTNSCYHRESTSMSFWDAELFCEAYGGNLASVHSVDENEFIQELAWDASCAHTEAGFQLGEVLLGGVYSGFRKGVSYWMDGSSSDYNHAFCDLFNAAESTVVMAAHPNKCGSCNEGQWFLPCTAPDSDRAYGEFICKAPAFSHLKRLNA